MKKSSTQLISKILGVILAIAIIASMFVIAKPASASTLLIEYDIVAKGE